MGDAGGGERRSGYRPRRSLLAVDRGAEGSLRERRLMHIGGGSDKSGHDNSFAKKFDMTNAKGTRTQ